MYKNSDLPIHQSINYTIYFLIFIFIALGCNSNTLKHSENLISSGKSFEAIELLIPYIEKSNHDPNAYILLGKAYKQLGQYNEAVQQFQKAAIHATGKPMLRIEARLELARTFLIYGDRDSAFKVLKLVFLSTTDQEIIQEIIGLVGDSFHTRQLTHNNSDNYSPSFSPDGNNIAFASFKGDNSEIYLMDLNGIIIRRVTYSTDFNDSSPNFLKSTDYLFYSSEPKSSREVKILIQSSGSTPIYTGFNITHIYNRHTLCVIPVSFGARVPQTSSNRVVYETNTDGNLELYLINLEIKNLSKLDHNDIKPTRITYTEYDEGSPAFFPNGEKIIFVSNRNESVNQLYTMTIDGKNEKHFNPNPYDCYNPSVSPDGNTIAFVSARDADWEIYIINANGKNERRITNGIGRSIQPTFSPDGKYLAFVSDRTDTFQIYLMDLHKPVTRKDIVALLR